MELPPIAPGSRPHASDTHRNCDGLRGFLSWFPHSGRLTRTDGGGSGRRGGGEVRAAGCIRAPYGAASPGPQSLGIPTGQKQRANCVLLRCLFRHLTGGEGGGSGPWLLATRAAQLVPGYFTRLSSLQMMQAADHAAPHAGSHSQGRMCMASAGARQPQRSGGFQRCARRCTATTRQRPGLLAATNLHPAAPAVLG